MRVTSCDVCGKEIQNPKEYGDAFVITSYGRDWDICDDCREELNKWFECKRRQYMKSVKENNKKKQTIKKKTSSDDSSAWDFHYNGYGDYEEERRCFYGDFG